MLSEQEQATLIASAREARSLAYVPYSGFAVGAALRTVAGRVFVGCNVENASYGLCNCAERTAFFSAIAAGCRPREFTHLAIVGDTEQAIAPCGACRQVMFELGGAELIVLQANLGGCVEIATAGKLLPGAFTLVR